MSGSEGVISWLAIVITVRIRRCFSIVTNVLDKPAKLASYCISCTAASYPAMLCFQHLTIGHSHLMVPDFIRHYYAKLPDICRLTRAIILAKSCAF